METEKISLDADTKHVPTSNPNEAAKHLLCIKREG
jgi:hypothetical protein